MTARTSPPSRTFPTRRAWRSWLAKHHARSPGVWLRLYKRHVGRGLAYVAAVEEALCFGWVDGQLRRIDDRRHMLRFTPRRPGSTWARSNIARVQLLIRAKRMTPAGLQAFRSAKLERQTAPDASEPKSHALPPDLRRALRQRPRAWEHWQRRPPSARRLAIGWVRSAKQPATRQRRIRNVVRNAARYARPHW